MAHIKVLYGAPISVTINLSGLVDGAYRQSDFIDNTSDLYVDVIAQLTIDCPNLAPTGYAILSFAASFDSVIFDGTGVTGADGTYPSQDFSNLYQMTSVNAVQNSLSSVSVNFTWYQGYVPPYYSFVVANNTGQTLGANSALTLTGVTVQSS